MPTKAPYICGCGHVVPPDTLCACQARQAQLRKQRADRKRGSAAARGYGADWRAARAAVLALPENKLCHWPGCTAPATHLDHKVPHKGDTALFWDRSNWQPLCEHHHNSSKQAAERRSPKTSSHTAEVKFRKFAEFSTGRREEVPS
jgi:5-methylcytosine-specific restriction endonuclease McrA